MPLPPRPDIRPQPRDERYPVCLLQERSVILDHRARLAGRPRVDNIALALRLTGPLQVDALRGALQDVANHHEPLRTVFDAGTTPPQARLLPADEVPLRRIAMSQSVGPVELLSDVVAKELSSPFDLTSGPMLRATLASFNSQHLLVLAMPHIVCDGVQSFEVLVRDLGLAYGNRAAFTMLPLPRHQFEYGDFAVTHRRWLDGVVREEILQHWRRQLPRENPEPRLPLPGRSEDSEGATGESEIVVIDLEVADVAVSLHRLRVTWFMALAAACCIAMRALASNQDEIGLLAPTVNPWDGTRELLGHFGNLAVVQIAVDQTDTGVSVLSRARERVLEAIEYSDLPYGEVLRATHPGRYVGPMTVPYLFLDVRTPRRLGWDAAGVHAEAVPIPRETKVRLHPGVTALAVLDGTHLRLSGEYGVEAYKGRTVEEFLRCVGDALIAVAHDPSASINRWA